MRRLLLPLAITVLVALPLAACGDGPATEAFPTSTDPAQAVPTNQRNGINVVVAGSDWFVGENNFVFGITDINDNPQGGATATATFFDLRDPSNPKPAFTRGAVASAPGVGAKTQHVHANGETHAHGGAEEDRVGYFVTVTFDHPGFWGLIVEATLKDGTKAQTDVGFQVSAKPAIVAPGAKAPKSDNLTKKDVSDIRQIDSGTPANDMHDVKIKDAIAAGRPLVVVFSTPAFCTSRFCGPVNEEVEALQGTYKDRVDFVHIEIWKSFEKRELNATVKEWIVRADGGLSEPWVFVVDAKGTVYDRWEGPVARNIMEASVKAVAEGKTK